MRIGEPLQRRRLRAASFNRSLTLPDHCQH
jgi:hypothetical protein